MKHLGQTEGGGGSKLGVSEGMRYGMGFVIGNMGSGGGSKLGVSEVRDGV